MKNIFKKNQVIITALAIMIAVAGYLNFTQQDAKNASDNQETFAQADKENKESDKKKASKDDEVLNGLADISDEDNLQLKVGDNGELVKDTEKKDEKETTKKADNSDSAGDAALVSKNMGNNVYSAAKLAREQTRAKNKEMLMKIVNNTKLPESQKKEAINNVIKMTEIAEKENATETLLNAKGFENCVVSIVDNSVDVVVGKEKLTQKDIAQIEDIVKRKTGISSKNIVITPTKAG